MHPFTTNKVIPRVLYMKKKSYIKIKINLKLVGIL